ncbi:hypothetical protein G6F70_002903 [Rhizopus microsporus]|nr:hypothetical protein G6F71_002834 [Rhizopus microsporus]KAG1201703.1 hypothetical protein G6F70_002903 [Rhizopus microsporus]KAG1213718.1 hypothetical protein G6F69_002556 [Rhizopus microsporus]
MKFISPREWFKMMKEKQVELQQKIAATPSATGLLAPRTAIHYKEHENKYNEFIGVYNEDQESPVIAWTKEGYNYRRSLFGAGKVEKVMQLGTMVHEMNSLNALANYINERNKKCGTIRRTFWDLEEREMLQAMHIKVKRRKRYLTMLALKEKHEKIFNEVEEQVSVSLEGVATFDETRLLAKYGVPLVSSQEQLLAEDDDSDAAFETLHEIDYEEEPEEIKEEDEAQAEVGLEELEEILLPERDLTHVGDLDDDDLIFEENLICRDILLFTKDQDRLYTKQRCNLCIEQDIQAPIEYPSLKQLALHLYTSQALTSWKQPTTTHRIGMHTRTAIFLREFQPISNGVTFSCGYLNCNFKNIQKTVVSQHLRKHLSDEGIQDASEEEAIQTMVQYIENVVGYTLSSLEIQGIISQRKANTERVRKRRGILKEAKEMETKESETKKQAKKPKAAKPKVKKTK